MHFTTGVSYFRRTLLLFAVLVLPAHALDIDAIRVHSALGERLQADIPVQASADELRALQVELAPAVVFARVGLERPAGAVAGLRFNVVQMQDRAVIRVTTDAPVQEDFFSFLVQLDWATGRMIREFSVALHERAPDSPGLVTAISLAEPPTGDVVALDEPVDTAIDSTASTADVATPIALATPVPVNAGTPNATSASTAPTSVTTSRIEPAARREASDDIRRITVAPGDTLSAIASRTRPDGALHEQALAALLVSNPHAFVSGNINRLRLGAELEMPSVAVVAGIPVDDARTLVAVHARAWRDGPLAAEMEAALAAVQSAAAAAAGATTATATATAATPSRLEITPHGVTAMDLPPPIALAGSAASLGASGPVIELVASQEAELQHLRARVVELEAASDEMRRVVLAQDQALARAQARLSQPDATSARTGWWWALLALALPASALAIHRYRGTTRAARVAATDAPRPGWHRLATQPSGQPT
ncbi:type IV pilus assembly protein FimV [Luteimonas sp. A649]